METKPKILLIGPGGVGTIVAYGIYYVGKADISIVVRRDYEKVKENGYNINSCDYGEIKNWKPDNIFPNVEAAASYGPFDFIVVATKNLPDIIKVEDLIEPVVSEHTSVALFQNGFDLGRPLIAKYPGHVIISGVSHIGSHNFHGEIHQTQQDKSFVSYFENSTVSKEVNEAKTKEFIALYSNEKNNCTYFPDGKWNRYKKLVYNASFNTICTLTGVDTGRLELSGGIDTIVLPAMREIIAIAKADGCELSDDAINSAIHSDDGDYFRPSMLVDADKGNPIELEVILGNLLRVANELGVAAPTLNVIYNLLKVVQFRLKEANGIEKVPKERPINDKYWK
ncbi:hypothetical protein PACTADRAFT_36125 [Pachysolen tannophilus NRRL Y-2460]|uniref:2-dehydropantoate 2-reductase n=1 Tax=Pachysolen tannophilus NRRL Y-2460 TaxID=669874 RepID=A0A1E4TP71_PACTA|nr:hypothetical protein PACTADRAFT_36125 [Pachysolen tannophilus NRRL Y-2460]